MDEQDRQNESPEKRVARCYENDRELIARAARRRGVPTADIDDVVQEVLRKLLRHLRGGKTLGNSRSAELAWLKTTTRNEAVDYHRRRKCENKRREILKSRHSPADPEPTVTGLMRTEQQKRVEEDVRTGLDSLEPEERSVLKACVVDGQTIAEYARQQGIGRKTAERRKHRGLQALAEKIEHLRPDAA